MPQKDKLKRQEYNKLQYLKNKEKKETLEVKPTPTPTPTQNVLDNYYLLKFFKNIRKVNKKFMNIKLKPVVNKVQVNLKEAIINELKIYQEKNKNKYESIRFKYKYIIIDLKLSVKLNSYIYGTDEPQYTGKCYNTFWVKRINESVTYIYKDKDHYIYYKQVDGWYNNYKKWETYIEIEEYYKIHFPNYKNNEDFDCFWKYDKNDWKSQQENQNKYCDIQKYINSVESKPTGFNTIKMRKPFKKMDYALTPIYHYNAKNIKFWDDKTKKTSNKGLEADRSFMYYESYSRHMKGWKFNGITLDEIKVFCHSNGLDKKISKNYKYGDYANWILKDLN